MPIHHFTIAAKMFHVKHLQNPPKKREKHQKRSSEKKHPAEPLQGAFFVPEKAPAEEAIKPCQI